MGALRELIVVGVVVLFATNASAQATVTSIDVPAELNARLAQKGTFPKERFVERERRVCELEDCGMKTCRRCRNEKYTEREIYLDVLRVGAVSATVNGELIVDPQFTLLPDTVHAQALDVVNCSATEKQSLAKTLSVTVQQSTSLQTTRSISSTNSVNANVSWNFARVGSAGLRLSDSRTVNLSTTSVQGTSNSVTQADQVTLTAPPRTRSVATLQVVEGGVQARFRGSVTFDAALDANTDGKTLASQLLSPTERTFDVAGVIRVTSASDSQLRRTDAELSEAWCKQQPDFAYSLYQTTAAPNAVSAMRDADIALKGGGEPGGSRTRQRRKLKTQVAADGSIRTPLGSEAAMGTPGDLCYIAPCNMPLDGFRQYCYMDEDGACIDCWDEYDAVCEDPERARASKPD